MLRSAVLDVLWVVVVSGGFCMVCEELEERHHCARDIGMGCGGYGEVIVSRGVSGFFGEMEWRWVWRFLGGAGRCGKTIVEVVCFVYDGGGRVGMSAPISRGLKQHVHEKCEVFIVALE